MEKIIIRLRNIILIKKFYKQTFIIICCFALYSVTQNALSSTEEWKTDPEKFINYFASQGINEILASNKLEEEKTLLFRSLLRSTFDFSTISKFVLGRNWNNTSELDQKKFKKLFEDIIVITWSRRFGDYDGQSLVYEKSNLDGENGFLAQTFILNNNDNNKINIQWRLRNRPDGLKIVDIIVEGVSMAITYRQDYNSVMRRKGGINGLILRLEKQLSKKIKTKN